MSTFDTREAWLREAANLLRPRFAGAGATLPANIRFAIAFPSSGRKGRAIGECWDASASDDQHFEIIVRCDKDNPVDVLDILTHELVHAGAGLAAGHGKTFKRLALSVGPAGPMRSTHAGPELLVHLTKLAEGLGPLPHAKLGFGLSTRPPKQDTRMLKVECAVCGYLVRVARKWLTEVGTPLCRIHGDSMVCEAVDEPSEADSVLLAAVKGT
jgi:hypothetical protein